MRAFEKAKWIWNNAREKDDEYVEFLLPAFDVQKKRKQIIKISADSNYAVYINGQLTTFGQYADYPHYKVYDEVDISDYLKPENNTAAIIVWYYGTDTQTYIRGNAGLIFEITDGREIIAYSSEETQSRLSAKYINHECRFISGQLGFTYHYDACAEDGIFSKSRIAEGITYDFNLRPNKKLILRDRSKSKVVMQGLYTFRDADTVPERKMQYADIGFRYFNEIAKGPADFSAPIEMSAERKGIFFIVDLEEEKVGFLDFDIEVPEKCRIEIGYGEHLVDGRCRTSQRNFTAVYEAKAGRNVFLNAFRRFGCRYLQFFIDSDKATVNYAGIRPTDYPLVHKKYKSGNLLRDTIYEVCQNTLQQCLHEHYEDCPWREQALYVMDSRNQMLSGYFAFNEFTAPRASLKLISEGLRADGLLSICYPAGRDLPIPSFSTMYFVQMYEYIKFSGDKTLAEECFDMLTKLINTFIAKIQANGLIDTFYSDTDNYWNFYEWSYGMGGAMGARKPAFEAPINAFFSIALRNMALICRELGKNSDADRYDMLSSDINKSIEKNFYNSETKLFESFLDRDKGVYSVLTNSLCTLCGAAENVDKSNILSILATNGRENLGFNVIPNTLSMNSFRFDALLEIDRDKYKDIILDEIDRDYLYMLRNGATSFWETIVGESDFGYAGSLCHGWSALPVYYYETLV